MEDLSEEDPSYLTQQLAPIIRQVSGFNLDLPAKLILWLHAGMWGSLGEPEEGLIAQFTFRFEKNNNVINYFDVFTKNVISTVVLSHQVL